MVKVYIDYVMDYYILAYVHVEKLLWFKSYDLLHELVVCVFVVSLRK